MVAVGGLLQEASSRTTAEIIDNLFTTPRRRIGASCVTQNYMANYTATVTWSRGNSAFIDKRYSREHLWAFDGGVTVPASSSWHVVPKPYSNPANVDPEEALVVALASCHMLSFLFVAARDGIVVDEYRDEAIGTMSKDERGKQWVSEVTLHPKVVFSGEKRPDHKMVVNMHHEAHDECYIANSVKTEVRIEGTFRLA